MKMYFGIKWNYSEKFNQDEFNEIKAYLLSFNFETTENSTILKFDLKDLRKLKIESLSNQQTKKELKKLQSLLNDDTKIQVYGDKMPVIESGSTGLSGYSGYSGTTGSSGSAGTNYLNILNDMFNEEIEEIQLMSNFDYTLKE